MVLDQSEDFEPDPRGYLALQGRILHRVGGWLRSRGLPGHFLWVREIGPRYGQQHTHLLLPLPPELGEDLAALIRRVGRLQDTSNNPAVYVQLNRRQGNTGIITLASRAGIMRDFLKTMSPKAKLQGIPIMPALALDNRKQKPCTVYGKRSGTSASLGRAARAAAGWRELVTLAELRAALPTGAEARRDRNQQRRRARRAAGPLPSTLPARSRSTDPFDATGLEADFLDDFVRVC
jgi:hypothetical protein